MYTRANLLMLGLGVLPGNRDLLSQLLYEWMLVHLGYDIFAEDDSGQPVLLHVIISISMVIV